MTVGLEVFGGINQFGFGFMHMNPEEMNDLILVHGVGAELRKGLLCPCQRIETNGPRIGCPVCAGVGWSYPASTRSPTIVLLLSREARQRDLAAGRSYSGSAKVTFPIGTIPARGDIIVPDEEVHVVQEVVHRSVAQVSVGALLDRGLPPDVVPAHQRPAPSDALLYSDIIEVESITFMTDDGERLVEAQESIDYTRSGRMVTWKPGHGPKPGSGFTARYRANAQYIVGSASPSVRSESTNGYPYNCSVERLDQWSAQGADLRRP